MLNQIHEQRQEQSISSQQIQQIQLLTLSLQELEERISHELEENPALEEGISDADNEETPGDDAAEYDYDEDSLHDGSLDDYAGEDDIPAYKLREMSEVEARRDEIPFAASAPSLGRRLEEQLDLLPLDDRTTELAYFVIGNISDDGYLRRSPQEMADDYAFTSSVSVSEEDFIRAVQVIQRLDPPGIGAMNLQECLRLQLERLPSAPARELALEIICNRFDDFANKRFDRLIKLLNIDRSELAEATRVITHLNPKPGNGLGNDDPDGLMHIRPDFRVEEVDGELQVYLPESRELPPLRVSESYKSMVQDYKGHVANRTRERREALLFARRKVEGAKWFIEAIRQREYTMRRTMEVIVQLQEAFFRSGDITDLRPMVLRDVAERIGMDISTVSRVASNKYVDTVFGIFRIKKLFSTSLSTDAGEDVSNKEVEAILAQLIEGEDKNQPLPDITLQRALAEKGYEIARRTVAKYRIRMGYPPARLRRSIVED